jgi:hypothetical protein
VGWSHNDPEFCKSFRSKFPKLVDSGNIKLLRYKLFECLDVEKINAAFDETGALKGVHYHARF